jgi:hypothetical protein
MEMTMKTTLMNSALLFGAIMLSTSTSSQAGPFQQCLNSGESRATCACERALRAGTDWALMQYMRNYDERGTACAAINSTSQSGGIRLVSPDQLDFGNYPTSDAGSDDTSK